MAAAVALYEPGATLAIAAERSACRTDEVRAALSELMDRRLPVQVAVTREIITGDLALVRAVRAISGKAIDGSVVELAGEGEAVLRKRLDQGWQLVVDDWNLTRRTT